MEPKRLSEFGSQTRNVFVEIFKALSFWSFFVGGVLLVSLHFIATTFHNFVHHVLHIEEGLVAGLMVALLALVLWVVKRNPPRFELELVEAPHKACRVLVLPLSRPGNQRESCLPLVDSLLSRADRPRGLDATLLAEFGGTPWRIPLESIAYQLNRPDPMLDTIVLLASTETREFEHKFRELVRIICAGRVDVIFATSLGSGLQLGVNYLDPKSLGEALIAVNRYLRDRKVPDNVVMFDVTAGTSLVSVLSTAAAFRKGRRIQYVLGAPDTSYQVKIWEPQDNGLVFQERD